MPGRAAGGQSVQWTVSSPGTPPFDKLTKLNLYDILPRRRDLRRGVSKSKALISFMRNISARGKANSACAGRCTTRRPTPTEMRSFCPRRCESRHREA